RAAPAGGLSVGGRVPPGDGPRARARTDQPAAERVGARPQVRAGGGGAVREAARPGGRRRPDRPRLLPAALALALGAGLVACGGAEGSTPTLTWYTNPDNGGQAALAEKCTEEADGRYRIEVSQLPADADSQREQLVRRLAANDSSIDIMSLDVVFVPEFAEAGFLRPFTDEEARPLVEDVLDGPLETTEWEGEVVAAPFWANTQLLWYRRSVA